MHTPSSAVSPPDTSPGVVPPILKVLLLLPYAPAAFMQADVDILSRHFDLDVLVHSRGKLRLALEVLRRLLFERPDVLLMWFIVPSYALPVTLLARLLGVRVAFVTGGYDIVGMPEVGYGALRIPLFRALLRLTIPVADLFLPFSRSASRQLRRSGKPRRSCVVYPGVDSVFFAPDASEREPLALTVAGVNAVTLRQKGLLAFVQAARYAPDMRWVLVGRDLDGSLEQLRAIATPNVEFVDRFVPVDELRDLYRRASCYVQASIHEGFGIAVAEAMCCGAVPIVTRRWSLPEVAGDLGSYVPLDDPQAVARAATESLHAPDNVRRELRARIVTTYPLERRERELTDALLALVPGRARVQDVK
ncbi:MAG TPA: glycosyltransferase [Chloroflexia bacterium]|nr:glycosyltransferase [Chloroflexia bacterium]